MTPQVHEYDGRRMRHGGEEMIVVGQAVDEPVVLLRGHDDEIYKISLETFRHAISAGYVHSTSDREDGRIPTPNEKERLLLRLEVLRTIDQLKRAGKIWAQIRKALWSHFQASLREHGFATPPTARTLQKWRKDHIEGGDQALVPKYSRCGNREYRHDLLFDDIVLDHIEQAYAASDRMNITELSEDAATTYEQRCAELGMKPGPCGRRIVERLVAELPHDDLLKRRVGAKEARADCIKATRLIKVAAPLDRVEIDCTTADVFVVDRQGKCIGRPTICAVIDAATGVILALVLSISEPDQALVCRALKEAMTPKPDAFFDQHDIQNRLQAYGRPKLIVADNGSEFSGPLIENAVKQCALEFRKAEPGHAERKPFIERLFREINRFLRTLLGASASELRPAQTRTAIAMKEACLTIDDVEHLLQQWRYDKYALRKRRRVMSPLLSPEAPTDCWNRLEVEHVIPGPPTPEELDTMFMVEQRRLTLQRYGIQVGRIQYHGPELADLQRRKGTGIKLDVRFDPHDVRLIKVWDEDLGRHIDVWAKDPDMPAISAAEAKRLQQGSGPLTAAEAATGVADGSFAKPKKASGKTARQRHDAKIEERRRTIAEMSNAPPAPAATPAPAAPSSKLAVRRPSAAARIGSAAPSGDDTEPSR